MVDTLLIPDLPLDTAVKDYSCWQQSRVDSHTLKDDIEKACVSLSERTRSQADP